MIATVLILIMAVLFEWAQRGGMMRANENDVPAFQFLAYSADVFLPIVDFGQAKYWMPDAKAGFDIITMGPWNIRCGGVLLLLYWCEIVAGWVLSTLLAGTVTAMIVKS